VPEDRNAKWRRSYGLPENLADLEAAALADAARRCSCCGSDEFKHPDRRCERCGGETFRLIPTRNGDLAECKGCGLVAVA
jgi:hypothetical protein